MSMRILVVDDEPNIVNILRSNLEREGYKVLAAYDGEEAQAPTLFSWTVCCRVWMDLMSVSGSARNRQCPSSC